MPVRKNGKVNGEHKAIMDCLESIQSELKSTNSRITNTNKRISLLDSNVSELIGFEDRIKIIVADHEEILMKRIVDYDNRDRLREENIATLKAQIDSDIEIAKEAINKFENFKTEYRTSMDRVDSHLDKAGECLKLYEGLVCVKGAKTAKEEMINDNTQ